MENTKTRFTTNHKIFVKNVTRWQTLNLVRQETIAVLFIFLCLNWWTTFNKGYCAFFKTNQLL